MAVEYPQSLVPKLPATLRALAIYLFDRDVGIPSQIPAPVGIDTDGNLDTISWTYSEQRPPGGGDFRRADGFLIAIAASTSSEPAADGMIVKVSIQSRRFLMHWPDSTDRSYAIATYRNTYQGEQATAFQQISAWRVEG
jgi:hypothetical protein